jgi:hypothetical protein
MGKIIPYYRPGKDKKPQSVAVEGLESKEEFDQKITPRRLLYEVLNHSDSITDILVMLRFENGTMGFVSTIDGLAENQEFIKQVKAAMEESK